MDLLSNSSSSLSDWSKIRNEAVPTSPAILYAVVSGYYFQGIYVSLYVEERRKDTLVMVIHHFVTLFLVSFSFGMRLWKIGVLVLFCHDFWNRFNLSSIPGSTEHRMKFIELKDYISSGPSSFKAYKTAQFGQRPSNFGCTVHFKDCPLLISLK